MALRVEIDGSWNAAEFAAFYQSLNEIYQFFLLDRDPFWLERGPYGRYIGYRRIDASSLQVASIRFASPGFTDLLGISAALRELRELIQFILTHISAGPKRRLEREAMQLEIATAKVDLLRKLLELPEMPPGRADEVRAILGVRGAQLPDIDPIIAGVLDMRIVGCKSVAPDKEIE